MCAQCLIFEKLNEKLFFFFLGNEFYVKQNFF